MGILLTVEMLNLHPSGRCVTVQTSGAEDGMGGGSRTWHGTGGRSSDEGWLQEAHSGRRHRLGEKTSMWSWST